MKKTRNYGLFLLVCLATVALPLISFRTIDIVILERYPEVINRQMVYQGITLLLAAIILILLRYSRKEVFIAYFRKGDSAAKIKPEPYVGIKPKPDENWKRAGVEWAIVISVVTALVIYLQVFHGEKIEFNNLFRVLPFVLLFAVTNSFVEESITRFGIVVALKDVYNDRTIAIISGILFGSVHYFGNPGGLVGVLVAGFLGWFLAKSIIETKGIFWAWLIHYLQDVIIMMALFSK